MEYLVRLAQAHETFRRPEIVALASLAGVELQVLAYSDDSPFCIVRLQTEADARKLISRAILSHAIYELWATAASYEDMHAAVKGMVHIDPSVHSHASFRFEVDSYRGKRTPSQQRELIESFSYLPFHGRIQMHNPDLHMCIFEHYHLHAPKPDKLFLGRLIAGGDRDAFVKYDLKKRRYIARTSMDSELSLVTANLTHAAPGRIIYDPFVGTGSFSLTCAHFGALALGSDIDGRSIRGTPDRNLLTNFAQYNTQSCFLDAFVADLTNSPVRTCRWLDGIICDPPYGVREGPKVLGNRDGKAAPPVFVDGVPAHTRDAYIPPKRQYAFDEMMADILDFGFAHVVDNGRISMWMPTANDEDIELPAPSHPGLELLSTCTQDFNKWSRQLLTYRRLPGSAVDAAALQSRSRKPTGRTANEVNRFRKKASRRVLPWLNRLLTETPVFRGFQGP